MNQLLQSINEVYTDVEKEAIIAKALNEMLDQEQRKWWSRELDKKYKVRRSLDTQNRKVRFLPLYRWMAVAASILVFIVVWQRSGPDLSTMSAHYIADSYIMHPGLTKGTYQSDVELQSQAIDAYRAKNFENAINLFVSIQEKSEEDIFFSGITYMQLSKYDEALSQFQLLEDSNNTRYHEELNWLMALNHNELNNYEAARQRLQQIQENEWKYSEAQKLLKLLEM